MPKAKKQTLTAEERMVQTLVLDDEQPYEVPGNWVWVKLGGVCTVKGGKRLPKGHTLQENRTELPYIRVVDFDNYAINYETLKYLTKETQGIIKNYVISSDDIYISIAGTIGKVGIVPDSLNGANLTENAAKINVSGAIYNRYLLYLLDSDDMQSLIGDSTIATTQAKLALFRIEALPLPLPPLAEQHRIVTRIESLFEKLDCAKDLVQTALDSFENRKAAILHKAFTGELTSKWREENGVGLESWKNKTLNELGSFKLGKMLDKAKNIGTPTAYLRNTNIRWFDFDLSDIALMAATDDDREKFSVKSGDLFICEGGEPGRCAVWEYPDSELIYQKALHRFRPNDSVIGKTLAYFLLHMSNSEMLSHYFTGTTIMHLTGQSIAKIEISLPVIPEQQEIIRILDNLLDKERMAQESSNTLEKIADMKKSILARAFRGELGTNNPDERSAKELLKETLFT